MVTPHDTRATTLSGRSASTLTNEASWTTLCSAKVPTLAMTLRSSPLEVVAHGAVGDLPGQEGRRAHVAEVGVPGDAHLAVPADGEEAGRHVVAHGQAAHARADVDHHPAPLVAPDDGEEAADGLLGGLLGLLFADVAPAQVLVRMAQTGRFPLDQDLELARRVQVDLFDLPILAPAIEDGCVRFHVGTPCAMTARSRVAPAVCHRSGAKGQACALFRAVYFPMARHRHPLWASPGGASQSERGPSATVASGYGRSDDASSSARGSRGAACHGACRWQAAHRAVLLRHRWRHRLFGG